MKQGHWNPGFSFKHYEVVRELRTELEVKDNMLGKGKGVLSANGRVFGLERRFLMRRNV